MSIVFIPDTFVGTNKKTGLKQTWYVICVGLAKDGKILKKSKPVLWLTEKEYEDYTAKK